MKVESQLKVSHSCGRGCDLTMAPRKDATGAAPSASQSQQDASSEGIEDFELPRVLVTQLAKSAVGYACAQRSWIVLTPKDFGIASSRY